METDNNTVDSLSVQITLAIDSEAVDENNNTDSNEWSEPSGRTIKTASIVISVVTLLILFVCLFIKNSLPTIVNISCLQQSFLALTAITYEHSKIESLAFLKSVLGYNYTHVIEYEEVSLEDRIKNLGLSSMFFNNFNVMFFIQTLFTISIVLLFYSHQRFKNCKKWLKIMQKQNFLLVVFNSSNLFFSLAIINRPTFLNILLSSLSIIFSFAQYVHVWSKTKKYVDFPENLRISNFKIFLGAFVIVRVLCNFILTKAGEPRVGLVGMMII